MVKLRAKVERAVRDMLKELDSRQLRETADFVLFLKTRSRIDPAQAYFWTARWQAMEQRVQQDKQQRRLLGTGSVDSLLRVLRA